MDKNEARQGERFGTVESGLSEGAVTAIRPTEWEYESSKNFLSPPAS